MAFLFRSKPAQADPGKRSRSNGSPRNTVNGAQAKLSLALNNIAYWHVEKYANAIEANAKGKASAAAVAKTEANAKAAANAAARLKSIEERSTSTNTGNNARAAAAQAAENAAARAVLSLIDAGEFNSKNMTANNRYKTLTNNNKVRANAALAARRAPPPPPPPFQLK